MLKVNYYDDWTNSVREMCMVLSAEEIEKIGDIHNYIAIKVYKHPGKEYKKIVSNLNFDIYGKKDSYLLRVLFNY